MNTTLPASMPGALHTEAWITLQTRQTQQLVQGRRKTQEKPAIVGLLQFAALVRQIAIGARQADPYAAWWLDKIQSVMEAGQATLQSFHTTLMMQLAQNEGVQITLAASQKPIKIALRFAHPLAFQGAYLLLKFDEIARAVFTVRQVSLLSRSESERLLQKATHALRRVFASALGYTYLGVTRQDIVQNTVKAVAAKRRMGILPTAYWQHEASTAEPQRSTLPNPTGD